MKNSKAVASMVTGIVTCVLMLLAPTSKTYIIMVGLLGIVPIVLSILAKRELKGLKKEGKGLGKGEAIAGKVLGIITLVLSLTYILSLRLLNDIEVASMAYCPNENQVSYCEDNKDGTSTCLFMNQMPLRCKNEVLKQSQYLNYVSPSDDNSATNSEE